MVLLLALKPVIPAFAQSDQADQTQLWNGKWIAEGSLFQIAVEVKDNQMRVTQVESLGFEWSSEPGKITGDMVQLEIAYAGVSGVIQAELVDANTAIAFAASCLPEFMLVCVLARDRRAVFRKLAD